MPAHPTVHPSVEVLRALALGKLDDSTASVVLHHLDSCPDCRKEVAAATNDDFLNRLRQVHDRGSTPAPIRVPGETLHQPQPPLKPTTLSNLPPELADNPDYEVVRELGRGGMGVVYQAKHRLSGRMEVLKVMNKALLGQPDSKERFLREIQSAARLDHKNVVKMYTALERGELMVLVMEYVQGEDLAQVVKSGKPLPVLNACYYVQQAALGLQHAFEKGMIHRDIKPQNLILAREGRKHIVKVLDFGLAKATRGDDVDTTLTGQGAMMGTPGYVAPEQSLDAGTVDIRADIYSLGCTLYHLLAGNPPFSGKNAFEIMQAHHLVEARPLNLVRPEVPEALAAVVRKMMAKKPAQRYQTPMEVVRALEPFVKGALKPLSPQPAAPQEGPWNTVPPPVKRETVIEGPSTITKAKLKPSLQTPVPPKGGQKDAASPQVIPETMIEGRATIAKGKLRPSPRTPPPLKERPSDAATPPGIPETMIEGDLTISRAMKTTDAQQSMKWLVVSLAVVLLFAGLFGLIIGFASKNHLPAADDDNALMNQSRKADVTNSIGITPKGRDDRTKMNQSRKTEVTNSIGMKFAWCSPGTFQMGSPSDEPARSNDEAQHKVTLTKGFYLGVHEVTQAQWRAVMDSNPSHFKGDNLPVEKVSWKDCQEFCTKLGVRDGKRYRLPMEAEWEYACRAGTTTPFSFGETISTDQANYNGNSTYGRGKKGVYRQQTTPVGSFPANAWGLYDMHGNVWEWCQDWYGPYPQGYIKDPQGGNNGAARVLRGGAWSIDPYRCRAAYRYGLAPGIRVLSFGCRVVLCLD